MCTICTFIYFDLSFFLSLKREKLDNMTRKEHDVRKIIKDIQIKQRRTLRLHIPGMYIFGIKLKWLEILIHVPIKYKKFHNRAVRRAVGQLKCYLNYVNLYFMNKNRSIYIPLIYGNLLPHCKNKGKQLMGKYFFSKIGLLAFILYPWTLRFVNHTWAVKKVWVKKIWVV